MHTNPVVTNFIAHIQIYEDDELTPRQQWERSVILSAADQCSTYAKMAQLLHISEPNLRALCTRLNLTTTLRKMRNDKGTYYKRSG